MKTWQAWSRTGEYTMQGKQRRITSGKASEQKPAGPALKHTRLPSKGRGGERREKVFAEVVVVAGQVQLAGQRPVAVRAGHGAGARGEGSEEGDARGGGRGMQGRVWGEREVVEMGGRRTSAGEMGPCVLVW
jgi:hypothetical protein